MGRLDGDQWRTDNSSGFVFPRSVETHFHQTSDLQGTISNQQLAPNSVDSSKIVDGTIVAGDLNSTIWPPKLSGTIVTVYSYQAAASVGGYAGGAWDNYPGNHDLSFTKKYSSALSRILVFGTVGAYKGVNAGNVIIGINFGSGAHQIGNFFFNALGQHEAMPCQDDTFTGLDAGAQVGRVRWDTTTTNVNTDANDAVRLTVMEVII